MSKRLTPQDRHNRYIHEAAEALLKLRERGRKRIDAAKLRLHEEESDFFGVLSDGIRKDIEVEIAALKLASAGIDEPVATTVSQSLNDTAPEMADE